jgi:hypothetical protein
MSVRRKTLPQQRAGHVTTCQSCAKIFDSAAKQQQAPRQTAGQNFNREDNDDQA